MLSVTGSGVHGCSQAAARLCPVFQHMRAWLTSRSRSDILGFVVYNVVEFARLQTPQPLGDRPLAICASLLGDSTFVVQGQLLDFASVKRFWHEKLGLPNDCRPSRALAHLAQLGLTNGGAMHFRKLCFARLGLV